MTKGTTRAFSIEVLFCCPASIISPAIASFTLHSPRVMSPLFVEFAHSPQASSHPPHPPHTVLPGICWRITTTLHLECGYERSMDGFLEGRYQEKVWPSLQITAGTEQQHEPLPTQQRGDWRQSVELFLIVIFRKCRNMTQWKKVILKQSCSSFQNIGCVWDNLNYTGRLITVSLQTTDSGHQLSPVSPIILSLFNFQFLHIKMEKTI